MILTDEHKSLLLSVGIHLICFLIFSGTAWHAYEQMKKGDQHIYVVGIQGGGAGKPAGAPAAAPKSGPGVPPPSQTRRFLSVPCRKLLPPSAPPLTTDNQIPFPLQKKQPGRALLLVTAQVRKVTVKDKEAPGRETVRVWVRVRAPEKERVRDLIRMPSSPT